MIFSRSQAEVDSATLKMSATLGTARVTNRIDQLAKDNANKSRLAEENTQRRHAKKQRLESAPSGESSDEGLGDEIARSISQPSRLVGPTGEIRPRPANSQITKQVPLQSPVIGSALRKNPDGSTVQPIVKERKKKKRILRVSEMPGTAILVLTLGSPRILDT